MQLFKFLQNRRRQKSSHRGTMMFPLLLLLFLHVATFVVVIDAADSETTTTSTSTSTTTTSSSSSGRVSNHKILYPNNDEYDSKILDPSTIYGSPYGGFSRATRSRLAALPLRLPDVAIFDDSSSDDEDEEEDEEKLSGGGSDDNNQGTEKKKSKKKKKKNLDDNSLSYFETSDGVGRGYICRVYHEDSLEAYSIYESMFDSPVLNTKEKKSKKKQTTMVVGEDDEAIDEEEDYEAMIGDEDEDMEDDDDDEDEDSSSMPEQQQQHSRDLILMETSRRLSKLEGVCSQIHLGWWSYEWCYDQTVTQFHIHVEGAGMGTGLELRDVTSLGKFTKRKYTIDLSIENPDLAPIVNKYAEDEPELSRVTDVYTDGDICDATGKPRQTVVRYFCCSDRLMEKYKGPVLRHGNPLTSKIVSIVNLMEDPEEVCTYTITVCTPLLCEDVKSDDDDGLLFDVNSESLLNIGGLGKNGNNKKKNTRGNKSSSSSTSKSSSIHNTRKKSTTASRRGGGKDGNESIRDVLDRVIGKACIQSSTSGWWSYEYCHRKHVRQFHESISINVETGLASSGTEDIYMLGYFNEELDDYPATDEYKHVVNTTLSPGGGAGVSSSDSSSGTNNGGAGGDGLDAAAGGEAGGGGGGALTVAAYFTSEYTGGDVCDDSDVTDSAVKAGGTSTSKSHVIERASSVRYSCGTSFDIYVKEDHTCHYIVEVSVPALCDHPMFKAPVAKKRVVKCIPVEGDVSEWES